LINWLKKIINKAVQWYKQMMNPPIGRDKKRLAKISSCHLQRKTRENLPLNQICVQLPGNRGHHIVVKDDEQIGNLRKQIAHNIGVNEKNWGIYTHHGNRLKIVEDNKQLKQIDRKGLHFYPKAVIR
jgi:hypothetical protein